MTTGESPFIAGLAPTQGPNDLPHNSIVCRA
jgi:hypothetical protein